MRPSTRRSRHCRRTCARAWRGCLPSIEQVGFRGLPRDAVKHLEDRLWELRITGRDGISRAIYLTAAVRRVVIVRVFVKKTQRTPPRELELARQRAKEVP
jgi:phage-related protein